jgi:hypothetical protein
LYFYRSRYYDPLVGRFISEDRIGFAGGDTNLYRYVRNRPLNFSDPFGYYVSDDPNSCNGTKSGTKPRRRRLSRNPRCKTSGGRDVPLTKSRLREIVSIRRNIPDDDKHRGELISKAGLIFEAAALRSLNLLKYGGPSFPTETGDNVVPDALVETITDVIGR